MHNKKRSFMIIACILIIVFICAVAIDPFHNKQTKKQEKATTASFNTEVEDTIPTFSCMFDYDYKNTNLNAIIASYMVDNALNTDNFSISYYNFTTNDQYYFNENSLMFAASTYKLPLCMYYFDAIAKGIYSYGSLLTYYDFCNEDNSGYIYYNYQYNDQIPLSILLYQSIVNSDNTASWILFTELGGWDSMMNDISSYSPNHYIYSAENYFTTAYMLDILLYIYQHLDRFNEFIDMMDSANSECYLSTHMEDIQIANKYGNYASFYNDVGIVFCDSPYAIAIYTDHYDGARIISELNRIIYEYVSVNA